LPSVLKRPGMLLLPVLIVLIPALLSASAVPPAPVPEGIAAEGARLPETTTRLSRASLERFHSLDDPMQWNRDTEADTVDVLALLVEFSDVSFPDSIVQLTDSVKIYPHDWYREQLERVNDYYRSVSNERVFIRYTLPDMIISLPESMGSYGDDELDWTLGVHWLAKDAVNLVDATVDFSGYDLTVFIHAGAGQESDLSRDSPEQIWSGYVDNEALVEAFADSLPGYEGILTDDQDSSYILRRFAIAPEKEVEESMSPPYLLGTLGVMAHQMGGYLGFVSLNDYVAPRAQGAGNFDLMSSGLWNALGFVPGPPSAFNRMLMGWADVLTHSKDDCESTLDLSIPSMSTLHRFPISPREYFLIENRDQDADGDSLFTFGDTNGNYIPDHGESMLGAEWDYFTTQANAEDHVPGSGLFIWRIDEELLHLSFQLGTNVINAWNDHYGVCLLEADGYADLSYSPGYHGEAYGSDYDAFRAAGGPNELIATQTSLDFESLPNTTSAEGADTGWSFGAIGVHGPSMIYSATWTPNPNWQVEILDLPAYTPFGDPLGFSIGDFVHFYFAAWDGENTTRLLSLNAEFDGFDEIADIAGFAAGSPAAGDLDGDGDMEIVLLDENGGVYAWHLDGEPLGDSSLLVQLSGWLDKRPMLHDVDGDGDQDIFVLEIIEVQPDSLATRPHFLDENGLDVGPGWAAISGLPASDPVLLLSVEESGRGYDHLPPDQATVAFALSDSSMRIHGLPLGFEETIWALSRECPCLNTQLAAGDLDGDGVDELLILRSGVVEIFHPKGRYEGPQAGEFEISADPIYSFADLASLGGTLMPLDEDGNGSLELLGLYPAAAGLWSADGNFLSDWPKDLPSNAPLTWTDDPAVWALSLRDANGADRPLIFTRDGRMLPEGPISEDAVLLGGVLPASPVSVLGDGSNVLMGLSFFDGVEGTSSAEDTLQTSPKLSFWSLDIPASPGGAPSWAMAGADPARSGRLAAAGAVDISGAGSQTFAEAYPYPNPAGTQVTWRVMCDSPDRVKIEIFDFEGQRLWSDELLLDGFSPAERELSLDDYAPGLYFFRIQSETSGRLETGRLAVIR
jgi:M6 family metalloprotease-like protein